MDKNKFDKFTNDDYHKDCHKPICYDKALPLKTDKLNKILEIQCPNNRSSLGNHTWNYLHTMAINLPENLNNNDQKNLDKYIRLFSLFYPCKPCSSHFEIMLERTPPKLNTNKDFSIWLCERHNEVNIILNKKQFDCSYNNLYKRWYKNEECN